MKNKAFEVRTALNLSVDECAKFLENYTPHASEMWEAWERTGRWSVSTDVLFDVLLALKTCEELKILGADKALSIVFDMIKPEGAS